MSVLGLSGLRVARCNGVGFMVVSHSGVMQPYHSQKGCFLTTEIGD